MQLLTQWPVYLTTAVLSMTTFVMGVFLGAKDVEKHCDGTCVDCARRRIGCKVYWTRGCHLWTEAAHDANR